MKKETICVIGAGWLGKPLVERLKNAGYHVTFTTAHNDTEGAIRLDMTDHPVPPKADIFIYTVPPLELEITKHFFDQIPTDQKIIFTSSTAVYGKNQGEVDEQTKPLGTPLLVQTEEYLQSRFKQLALLRLGGLYGNGRHPVHFLAGKKNLKTGDEFLHLAHLEDCLQAIHQVLVTNTFNDVINVVSDLRMKKKDYYMEIAKRHALPLPEYDDLILENPTRISNLKSKQKLQMVYLDPSQP